MPLFFASGEDAFTRYHIEENVIGLVMSEYFVAAVEAYYSYVEVLSLEDILLAFVPRG